MTSVAGSIADAMLELGLGPAFAVLGDGNLEWTAAVVAGGGEVVQARHEGNAVAMADGAARASNAPGLASVTCGPGLTQAATALVTSARSDGGLVVFAGDTPADPRTPRDRAQQMDQERFASALGCGFVRADAPAEAVAAVRRAYEAAEQGRTVVLSCRTDVQRRSAVASGADVHPGSGPLPGGGVETPVPAQLVDRIVTLVSESQSPFVLVGRGAASPVAEAAVCDLAPRIGAIVGTTMPAKHVAAGDDGHVGVVGGYGSPVLRELTFDVDLVVAVGTSLSSETLADGQLFPHAKLIHVSLDPPASDHSWVSVLRVAYDASAVLQSVLERLSPATTAGATARRREAAEAARSALAAEVDQDPWREISGTVDARSFVRALAGGLPDEAVIVSCVGHFGVLPPRHIAARRGQRWIMPYDFGAIGQGISFGLGAALATKRPTIVFEGDGGAMMNIQELDTVRRTDVNLAVVVMNDQGLGAEYHELLRRGLDPTLADVSPPSFAALAAAIGVRGMTVRGPDDIAEAVALIQDADGPLVIDVRTNPEMRRRSLRWARGYQRVS